jgi:uncharacterized membrane protein YbhN (UPF0104 family)
MIMSTYWFRPKRYGYGATPVTWQGWLVTLGSVVVIVGAAGLVAVFGRNTPGALLGLVVFEASAIVLLCLISAAKTEGEWRWRWGSVDESK